MRPRPFTIVFLLAAAAGLFFTGWSTADFVAQLDRQVHSIHCSFVPGLDTTDATGSSGCHVTMMSPYSSVLRSALWGGLPISLPGMGVFAFLLFRGLDLLLNGRENDRGATGFVALAAVLPLLTSLVMGYISLVTLGAACKLCIGTYIASTVAFLAALAIWRTSGVREVGIGFGSMASVEPPRTGMGAHIVSFAIGVAFVAIPALTYVISMPDYDKYIGACGSLPRPEDTYGIFVPVGQQSTGKAAIEVFDPLCPACRAFETRLDASGLGDDIKRKAVMFPLDNSCNWMIGSALHPGACMVSEAVLCADTKADGVIAWAFAHQDEIKVAAAKDPKAALALVTTAFPELKSCIGTDKVKQKLNKSLRWAVANQLPVLTPQLYVDGVKLCDEDTDLGMDYALTRLLAHNNATAAPAKEAP